MSEIVTGKPSGLTNILLSIISAGFLAWSGVVWYGVDYARQVYVRVDAVLTRVEAQLNKLQHDLDEHKSSDGHGKMVERVDGLRREVDRLRADQNRMFERENGR